MTQRKRTVKVKGEAVDLTNGNRVALGRADGSWVLRCYAREGNSSVVTTMRFSDEALWALGALIVSASKQAAATDLALAK